MKLTGKEIVSLHAEKNGEYYFGIYEECLNKLLNVYILDKFCMQLIKNEKTGIVTNYLKINDMKISKGTKVSLKFQISLKETITGLENKNFTAIHSDLDISDFYNLVVELFDYYACKLNTVIDNIKIELIELEIKNSEVLKGE